MIKKKIMIGFVVGIIANLAGIILYILLFSEMDKKPPLTMPSEMII